MPEGTGGNILLCLLSATSQSTLLFDSALPSTKCPSSSRSKLAPITLKMSNNGDADKLAESKIQHEKYPLNLVRAEDFSYVLQKYHTTLQNGELRFFCKQNLIVIWDLKSAEDS